MIKCDKEGSSCHIWYHGCCVKSSIQGEQKSLTSFILRLSRKNCKWLQPIPTFITSGSPTGILATPRTIWSLRMSSTALAIPNTAFPKATTETFLSTVYSLSLMDRIFWWNKRLFLTISCGETALSAAPKIVWASDFSLSWRSVLNEE